MPAEHLVNLHDLRPALEAINGFSAKVYVAPEGSMIDISEITDEGIRGPRVFDSVVFFDAALFASMYGGAIDESQRWNAGNPPPQGVEFLEFYSEFQPSVSTAAQVIERIANDPSETPFYDPELSKQYSDAADPIFALLAQQAGIQQDCLGIGIARAGLPSTEKLGINQNVQFILDCKRCPILNMPNHLAIGIRIPDRDILSLLHGRDWVSGEGAGATYSTLIAKTLALRQLGIEARSETWISYASTHQGAALGHQFLNRLKESTGTEGKILSARYSSAMTGGLHGFYLLTEAGNLMVHDVGDIWDIITTPNYRRIWPGYFSEQYLKALYRVDSTVPWDREVKLGQFVDIEVARGLSNLAIAHGHDSQMVGRAMHEVTKALSG